MTDLGLKPVPARNLLTGAVVTLPEDEGQLMGDAPGNLTLAWKDLSVYRRKKHQNSMWRSATYEEVKVIHEVNGVVSSGNLIALMGASGAGKTSLLAAISRRDKSTMTGYLMLNGRLAGAELIARISGFVPQQDLAVEDLNVMEHMEFMVRETVKQARLMMDRRSVKVQRTKRINQLLQELGIANCTKTRLKDLSGGERKRVALAVQLLNDPPILFCDEPTSGLDSWAASAVVSRLRDLAAGGKIVVCSVHQPASGVFDLFHQVVLLASGKIAFHGNLEEASNFFASIGYKCPLGFNAAEYYVSLLGVEQDKEIESRERIRRICDEYQRSDIATAIEEQIADVPDEMEYFSGDLGGDEQNQYLLRYLTLVKVGFFVQFYWLMWRNIQSIKHNSNIYWAEFVLLMFVGIIISVPYMGHFNEMDQRDIQNIEGLLYLTITEVVFLFIYAVFITFPSEVPILLRETANGLYSPGPYYLSKMLFWIPRAVIQPTLFGSLIFLVAGLRGGFMGWLGFIFICVLCANWGNAYGSFLSAVFDKLETAALFSVPFELVGTMFSGIYLNLASVSPPISWLRYISGFYYGVESISILQWNAIDTINCVPEPGQPCIRTGHDVINRFGFDEDNFWRNCICLVVMYFVSHLISFLMVIRRSRGTPVY